MTMYIEDAGYDVIIDASMHVAHIRIPVSSPLFGAPLEKPKRWIDRVLNSGVIYPHEVSTEITYSGSMLPCAPKRFAYKREEWWITYAPEAHGYAFLLKSAADLVTMLKELE